MFYKVKNVKALDNFVLLVTFENEVTKYYDIKNLLDKFSSFQDLINIKGLFMQVKVDTGGYGVSWNKNLDISCNELWENGV